MKKLSSNSIKKAVLQASLALLLCVTYMTSMNSCGKGAVAMDSVNKSENWYTSDSAAGYDDYYGEIEPEAPSKESIYDSTASSGGSCLNQSGNSVTVIFVRTLLQKLC